MSLLSKWFWQFAFETLDSKTIAAGKWSREITLNLRGNRQTGEKYLVIGYGGDNSPRLTAAELASFIEAAQALHRKMV